MAISQCTIVSFRKFCIHEKSHPYIRTHEPSTPFLQCTVEILLHLAAMTSPHRNRGHGLTCLGSHTTRKKSLTKRTVYRFIGGFRPGSRRSSDLGGEELGDFCSPRPEEWEWNVETNQTEDARMRGSTELGSGMDMYEVSPLHANMRKRWR